MRDIDGRFEGADLFVAKSACEAHCEDFVMVSGKGRGVDFLARDWCQRDAYRSRGGREAVDVSNINSAFDIDAHVQKDQLADRRDLLSQIGAKIAGADFADFCQDYGLQNDAEEVVRVMHVKAARCWTAVVCSAIERIGHLHRVGRPCDHELAILADRRADLGNIIILSQLLDDEVGSRSFEGVEVLEEVLGPRQVEGAVGALYGA